MSEIATPYFLKFLKTIGFNQDLVDCLANMYTNKPNVNIGYLIDSIGKEAYRANKYVFKYTSKEK